MTQVTENCLFKEGFACILPEIGYIMNAPAHPRMKEIFNGWLEEGGERMVNSEGWEWGRRILMSGGGDGRGVNREVFIMGEGESDSFRVLSGRELLIRMSERSREGDVHGTELW